ncbi:MAG: NusG domain II-containing protein [Clostridia bacterium]|nr:NusG domain II-containing protein [Clostridia bacterium]
MVKTRLLVLIVLLVTIPAIVLSVVFLTRDGDGSGGRVAVALVDGKEVWSIDLTTVNEPFEKTIVTPYGTNTLFVERDRIRIKEADCEDETCVKTGYISSGGAPIVCLPHRLVVKIVQEGGVDAVSE